MRKLKFRKPVPPLRKILILGGGFGGVETYRQLHRRLHPFAVHGVRVELINRTNYLTFTPMLHEVATGSVAREHVVQPIREMMACCGNDFHQAEVTRIDLEKKVVETSDGLHPYDILVIALGVAQDFKTPGAREYAAPLKQLHDAVAIRNRIILAYERASEKYDRRELPEVERQLHFVVVGGGATGTELAGQLADLMQDELRMLYGDVPHGLSKITLVHAGDKLLEQFSPRCAREAKARLTRMGVSLLLNERAEEVTADGVTLASGKKLPTKNVFWTTGTASNLDSLLPAHVLDEKGLVKTDAAHRVVGAPAVFALGDCAAIVEPGYSFPPLAQAAVQAAGGLAENVIALVEGRERLRKRRYRSKGDILPIGDWYAIFERGNVCFTGKVAWWLRRTVFLMNMYSWSRRLRVVSDWAIQIFQPRDTAEL